MAVRIKLKSVEEKIGNTGDEFRRVQAGDGKYYSCWDTALFPLLKPGAWLEVTIQDTGKYKNITAAAPSSPGEPSSPGGTASPGGFDNNGREEAIGRQVCLKCATELSIATIASGQAVTLLNVLRTASTMHHWLKGGMPQTAPEEAPAPAPATEQKKLAFTKEEVDAFQAGLNGLGFTSDQALAILGVKNLKEYLASGKTLVDALKQLEAARESTR